VLVDKLRIFHVPLLSHIFPLVGFDFVLALYLNSRDNFLLPTLLTPIRGSCLRKQRRRLGVASPVEGSQDSGARTGDAESLAAGRSRFLRKVMTELPAALPVAARAELLRAVREYLDAEPAPGDGSSEPDAVRQSCLNEAPCLNGALAACNAVFPFAAFTPKGCLVTRTHGCVCVHVFCADCSCCGCRSARAGVRRADQEAGGRAPGAHGRASAVRGRWTVPVRAVFRRTNLRPRGWCSGLTHAWVCKAACVPGLAGLSFC
jgi:hypothetical protein